MSSDVAGRSSKKVLRAIVFSFMAIGVRSIANVALVRVGLHFLGEAAFGLWVLLQSFVTYLNLADMGVGQSIMNAQSAHAEKKDWSGASRVLSSSVFVYLGIAVCTWLLVNGAIRLFPGVWKSEALTVSDFQSYFLLLSTISLSVLPLSAFSASLGGLRDLDIRYMWEVGLVVLMSSATAMAMVLRWPLLAILAMPLCFQLMWYLIPPLLLQKRHPEVHFRATEVSRPEMKSLVAGSLFIFMISLSVLTQRFAANFVAGSFISVQAVAKVHPHFLLFQVFGWSITDAITRTMLPYITGMSVRKDWVGIRFVTMIAAKTTLIVAGSFSLFVWIMAEPIFNLWLGKGMYLGPTVIGLLVAIFMMDSAAMVFTNFSLAVDKYRRRAVWIVIYAFCFAAGGAAGVTFSNGDEVIGMSAGFFVVTLVFQGLVFPILNALDLGVKVRDFYKDVFVKTIGSFGLLFVLLGFFRSAIENSFLRAGAGLAVAALGVIVCARFILFTEQERNWLGERLGLAVLLAKVRGKARVG